MNNDMGGQRWHVTAVVDSGGKIVAWSTGASRLLGYEAGEVVGRQVETLLASVPVDVRRACDAGQEWRASAVAVTHSGQRLELMIDAQPLARAGDEPLWLLAASPKAGVDDVTLKQWAMDQLPIAVLVCDNDERVVAANNAFTALLNRSEENLHGLDLADVAGHTASDAEAIPALAHQARVTGDVMHHQTFTRSSPRAVRDRSWSSVLFPLKDPAGRIRGVASAVYDTSVEYWARQRLALVNEASIRIGTTLDIERTAQELADLGIGQYADFAVVDLLDSVLSDTDADVEAAAPSGPLRFRRCAYASVPDGPQAAEIIGSRCVYPEDSPQAQALVAGRAVAHRFQDGRFSVLVEGDAERAQRIGPDANHAALLVPLQARGVTLGLAQFYRHRIAEPFDDEDVHLAWEIGTRAALCIDNALRYSRERTISVTLQRSLLQQTAPEQSAVDVATRYLPAGAGAGVGGDWYDVIPLSGARVALVVGDVVGHGLRASAVMAQLRTAVRTLADVDLAPDELLTQLDDVVLRLPSEPSEPGTAPGGTDTTEISATCLYVVYDPVSRHCSMASAGHVLPAVATPDGKVKLPDLPVGPPLGFGGLPFEIFEFDLPEGSVLALYTDGLIESRDRDLEAGQMLLCEVLSHSAGSLESTCDALLDTLQHEPRSDDVALLLARTQALDTTHVATWDLPEDPEVVAQARKRATRQLSNWGLEEAAFVTELVVSELVTNAIRYGGGPIQLRLIKDSTLICEVSDASNTAPHLRRARVFDEGGRGLLLVAQLTDRWGTRQTRAGKTIWAEQVLTPSAG
ncbi:SpoIIE family protein phosphatase [Streptomyces chartreusis]|uniref:ATP-binding SpoIIE family protein phosphatase n=1 Tax=Streptomyces chartreusis TaxID=1969 RepID=UPI0036FB5C32